MNLFKNLYLSVDIYSYKDGAAQALFVGEHLASDVKSGSVIWAGAHNWQTCSKVYAIVEAQCFKSCLLYTSPSPRDES
jgi:hypothetical protein